MSAEHRAVGGAQGCGRVKGYRRSTGLWAGQRVVGVVAGPGDTKQVHLTGVLCLKGPGGARPGREGSPRFRAYVKPTRNICGDPGRQDGWLSRSLQ